MVNQETKFVLREERKADADHEDLYVYGLALPRDDYRVTKISDEKAAIKQLRGFEGRPVKMEHGQEVLGSVHTVEFKREGMFVGLKLFPPASVEDHNVHLARKVRGLILQRRLKELSIGFYTTDTGISPIEISLTSEGALKVGLYNFVSFSKKSNGLDVYIMEGENKEQVPPTPAPETTTATDPAPESMLKYSADGQIIEPETLSESERNAALLLKVDEERLLKMSKEDRKLAGTLAEYSLSALQEVQNLRGKLDSFSQKEDVWTKALSACDTFFEKKGIPAKSGNPDEYFRKLFNMNNSLSENVTNLRQENGRLRTYSQFSQNFESSKTTLPPVSPATHPPEVEMSQYSASKRTKTEHVAESNAPTLSGLSDPNSKLYQDPKVYELMKNPMVLNLLNATNGNTNRTGLDIKQGDLQIFSSQSAPDSHIQADLRASMRRL